MDNILENLAYGRILIADHVSFHKRNLEICLRHQATIDAEKLIGDYREKVTIEEYIYKWMKRMKYTEDKAKSDNQRDGTYTGFAINVRANLRHFDPDIVNAASHIMNLLANYGDVVHASYDAETAAIDSIVSHLRSEGYIKDVNLLGVAPWIDRLDDFNAQFKQFVQENAQEEINKPEITPKESRLQTDKALKKITARVESLANLNGKDEYMPFAREFNELTNHYKQLMHEHYGRTHVRTDIDSAYIAPIPTQTFTGKPIFVIPEVKLTKKTNEGVAKIIELVFTEDFTVSYKNNIKKGTATIRIQGIGKYKGEIVTTFNID
jgi:hypothetical protein